jgi:putative ATPase
MKKQGYGEGYKYPHAYPGHFVMQSYFPETFEPVKFYEPANNPREEKIREYLERIWKRDNQ